MPAPVLPLTDVATLLPPRGTLIGLDLGTKTIGVAASDHDRRLATGVETVARKTFTVDAQRLLALAGERRAVCFVLGLPINMDGSEGPRAQSTRAFAHLDVAGGTGDVAFRVVAAGGAGTRAVVCDINQSMLQVGRARAARGGHEAALRFVEGNAEALPFPDRSFDAYTIAFGIRNVPRADATLREAFRVLKVGGHFLCLEFSSVDVPGLDVLYDLYSFNVVPALGRAVVGDAEPYRYLVESIRRFPKPEAFAAMIRDAGFRRVSYRPLSGGIVALHSGWRL